MVALGGLQGFCERKSSTRKAYRSVKVEQGTKNIVTRHVGSGKPNGPGISEDGNPVVKPRRSKRVTFQVVTPEVSGQDPLKTSGGRNYPRNDPQDRTRTSTRVKHGGRNTRL